MPFSLTILMNIPSHYQMSLAAAFHELLGDRFRMVFVQPVEAYRQQMGWFDADAPQSFVIRAWESEDARQQMHDAIRQSDVVVEGDVPFSLCEPRLRAGGLTFRQSERIWKRGLPFLVKRRALRDVLHDRRYGRLPHYHLLAIGAYCTWDMGLVGGYRGRAWRWGYFPAVPDQLPVRDSHDGPPTVLWAGRMARFKKLPVLIEALARVRRLGGPDFQLRLVGDGRHCRNVEARIRRLGLDDVCQRQPYLPAAEVLAEMRRADLVVVPSDYGEGWGVVLNEAMACACCTLASVGAGATPWLIRHGETGFAFPDGDVASLAGLLERLLADPQTRSTVGRQAWLFLRTVWSPQAAAERLLALAAGLLGQAPMPDFVEGPCSADPGQRPAVGPWWFL